MAANRKAARDELETLLAAALVGTGLPAQAVYGYRPADFDGKSPVVCVSHYETIRPSMTMEGNRATVTFQVDVFVLYTDGLSWGPDDAEDAADDVEAGIAGVVAAFTPTTTIDALSHTRASEREDLILGGIPYLWERVYLDAEIYA